MSKIILNKMNSLIDKLISHKCTIEDLNKKIEKKRKELEGDNIIEKEKQNILIYIMLLELLTTLLEIELKQASVGVVGRFTARRPSPIEGNNILVEALRRRVPVEIVNGRGIQVEAVAEKDVAVHVTPLKRHALFGGRSLRSIKKK